MKKIENVDMEIKKATQDIISSKESTVTNKNRFITQIKTSLGEEIKKNPNKVKIIKKSKFQRFMSALTKLISRI